MSDKKKGLRNVRNPFILWRADAHEYDNWEVVIDL